MCWPAFKFVLAVTVCPKFCATLLSKSTCKKQNALDPKEKRSSGMSNSSGIFVDHLMV